MLKLIFIVLVITLAQSKDLDGIFKFVKGQLNEVAVNGNNAIALLDFTVSKLNANQHQRDGKVNLIVTINYKSDGHIKHEGFFKYNVKAF
jgi:hypothetical protein